jgi:hypothetical protein
MGMFLILSASNKSLPNDPTMWREIDLKVVHLRSRHPHARDVILTLHRLLQCHAFPEVQKTTSA